MRPYQKEAGGNKATITLPAKNECFRRETGKSRDLEEKKMKKLVAVLMILCVVMTAAAAFAEETEPNVVNWILRFLRKPWLPVPSWC